MDASWRPQASHPNAHVACTCAHVVTKVHTLQLFAETPKRVDASSPQPCEKIRKEDHGGSGGAIGRPSEHCQSALCTQPLHGTTLSEDEMDSELEETPNGETQVSHMGPPEEMKNNHTQPGPTSAKSFHGMSLEDLFIIEICAGSARLSKVAHQCGFRTMAVDHSTARSCGFPICVLI